MMPCSGEASANAGKGVLLLAAVPLLLVRLHEVRRYYRQLRRVTLYL